MLDSTVRLHRAGLRDVPEISRLVNEFAAEGRLLPRSEESVRQTLADWVIAQSGSGILGCGSLVPYAGALAEIRSLAVAQPAQGMGLGSSIVSALIDQARSKGVRQVFALTRAVRFFERLGFSVTPTNQFPEKIWRDCRVCPVRHRCDETAVVLSLEAAGWRMRQAGGAHVQNGRP